MQLIYIVNPGVKTVQWRASSRVQVHVDSAKFGDNGLWRCVYNVRFPGITPEEAARVIVYTFRLVVTRADSLTTPRVSWYLNSGIVDSGSYPYPTPVVSYAEEPLQYPFLNKRVGERDETEYVEQPPGPVSTDPPILPEGMYRLVCNVNDGFEYTMYHELLAQYRDTSSMVFWKLTYYPDSTDVMLYQSTVNGNGWLQFISGPAWSDKPYAVVVKPKADGWVIGDGTRFIGGFTSAGGPGYASSIATYTPSFTGYDNALVFQFQRDMRDAV